MNTIITYRKPSETTKRKVDENSENTTEQNQIENKRKSLKTWQIILIVAVVIIIIIISISIFIIIKKRNQDKTESGNENQDESEPSYDNKDNSQDGNIIDTGNNGLTKKEALKAFKTNFTIVSKTNKLNQVLMKSNLKQTSISNGVESTTLSVFTMAKIDIFTLNESYSGEDTKEFYSRKYFTAITINSICNVFLDNKTDCELKKYLDLNVRNKNLRRNDEKNQELIKEVILPICIVEHTNTNIIISVICPETLSSNLKENIILSFQSIKPTTVQGIVEDDSVAGTNITEKDNKKYIDSFIKGCDDYDGNPSINETCEEIKNIVTDLDGNVISVKKNSTKEIIKDTEHKENIIKTYFIEDISNSENFDSNNYKKNLDTVFELIKPYMKKEDFLTPNSFNEILEDLMKGDSNTTEVFRGLQEEEILDNSGSFEDTIFSKNIYGMNIELYLKNNIGLDSGSRTRIISGLKTGQRNERFSQSESDMKLNETMNKFISLSNAANVIASSLHEELNEPLLEIRNNIDSSINALNKLLSFEDLSSIFDATLAVSDLSKLPFTIVASAENLFTSFSKINNDISYSINDYKNILKQSLSSFLSESHQLLYNIFSNLTEATNLLSSKKSKIAEIYSYYLNNTDTSYVDIIQKVKEIMSHYYINEKEIIKPLIDKMLNDFYNKSLISTEKVQTTLDTIVEKLTSEDLHISLGDNQDAKKVIDNIYNAKMKVKEILSNIVSKFNNSIGYQDSGYFESQKELNANNESFGEASSNAFKIANTLDNNLLIDTTYDKIMEYFRDQFVVLLNYMDKSKREKFPLKENVLKNSTFTKENIDKIDENFKKDKESIILFVKNENKEYLKFVKESLDNFKKENQQNLEKYISNIQVQLSDLNLNNLNSQYNDMLTSTMNKIDKIIKDNNALAVEYLTNVKNTGTVHCTQGFKDKYNIYIKNINIIRNYIQLNLKNNLFNKYKNIINQIRSFLQKIKTNPIIEKYQNHLSFSEAHLRVIDKLFAKFDKYISDSLFNKNYLTTINNYISNTKKNLDNLETNLNNLYSQIYKKLPDINLSNDYTKKESNCWKCCIYYEYLCKYRGICYDQGFTNSHRRWCWKRGTCCNYYYKGYNIKETNNHLSLKTIEFNQYSMNFDKFYSSIYNEVSTDINNYCNSLNNISTLFDSKKNELLSKNVNYLISFSNNSESILNNYLGSNILTASYNYYKNELEQKIPNELDDILSKWEEVYDKLDEDLNSNLNKFKVNIKEFGLLCGFYYQTYKVNISYGYVDSIVEERKNDLNYTIKYYYNMISSKINKTYSYIINNIPINDKPFDELLNTRIMQIKNIYNNIITKIQESRNQILSRKAQLAFLKVSESNFFLINGYINDNADKIDEEIKLRTTKVVTTSYKLRKSDTEENIIAKFFIENAQNGKQIKKINEPINRATYTDLQSDVYQNLIEEIFEIEKDELIKNIINSLKESNEKLNQSYKYEKDKYSTIIQDKIYNEYFTKENLENEINNLYNNGLKDLDTQSKNVIYGYLDQVLNNIKEHTVKEVARLNNEMTSYSYNYKVIETTLNEYKEKIYNGFYSTIVSVVENFYNQTKNIFYTEYIEKYLGNLTEETNKEKFTKFSFLNTSFNLKETIDETVELLINEYKNLSMSQIEYLYKKNIQNLTLLFSFSSMKDKINNEISNIYNSVLLPALKVYAKYNPGDEGISDYDFSTNISNNINSILNTNIKKTKDIINKAKGEDYNITFSWDIPDFSRVKNNEFQQIKDSFSNFTSVHNTQELEKIKEVIFENLKNNYNIFINNFVPSFGIDYFDRILNYNEIQKIKSLYSNLKYSLTQTLIYYIGLCSLHTVKTFPDDLKYKILSLNDMESTIRSNNNKILSSLNSKFDEFIKNTQDYIVEKYISEIKIDPSIHETFKFNNKIVNYTGQILDGKRYFFEKEYTNKMNNCIKNPFIQQYSKTLNKETNDMIDFIEENKVKVKAELNKIFTLKPDDILSEIENKLNNTLKAIEAYNLHFNSFIIPDKVKKFLEQYISNEIIPKYEEINNIINAASKDLIKNNLETNSEKFKNSYNYEEFESKSEEIKANLTNRFNKINETIKSYGAIESIYLENLEKEKAKYDRIRNLDELDDDKIAYNRRLADVKLDETFQEIKNSTLNIKQFIESLNLFKEFEEKINKYINDINYQYGISQNIIKKNKENSEDMDDKLNELNSYSLHYYKKVNSSYHKTKELIIESIGKMNELIENCTDITFKTMAKKYNEIKEEFNSFNHSKANKMNESEIFVDDYNETIESNNYNVISSIKNYEIDDEMKLEIISEEGEAKAPKIVGKFTNKNRPKNWEIDIYTNFGQSCEKFGRKITAEMNNVSLSVDFEFDGGSNKASFNTRSDFDEYEIKNKFYETKEITEPKEIGGLTFFIPTGCDDELDTKIPDGEKEKEIINAKYNESNIPYNFLN